MPDEPCCRARLLGGREGGRVHERKSAGSIGGDDAAPEGRDAARILQVTSAS